MTIVDYKLRFRLQAVIIKNKEALKQRINSATNAMNEGEKKRAGKDGAVASGKAAVVFRAAAYKGFEALQVCLSVNDSRAGILCIV